MLRMIATALGCALLLASPAVAQSQPTPRQLELSRRYVNLLQGDQLEQFIRSMLATDPTLDDGDLPPAEREFILDLTAELVADLMPAMMEEMVPVYAAAFTEEELEALVAFYDSPLGRSILAKTMDAMPEVNAAMAKMLPLLLEKMAVRMCARYGCDPREALAEMYAGAGLPPPAGSGPVPRRTK